MPESKHRRNRRPRNLEIPRPSQRGGSNKFILVVSIIIAALVIGSFALVTILQSIGGEPEDVALGTADAYVEGVGQKQEIMRTRNHVDLNNLGTDDDVTYNSAPPTSGDHWSAAQSCGFYTEPILDERIVHNLEHSNIVISYNLPSDTDVEALEEFYDDLDESWRNHFTVIRPYDEIGEGQIGLSAWGVMDVMDGIDRDRILRFYEHYVGRLGPEGAVSCRGAQSSMQAG